MLTTAVLVALIVSLAVALVLGLRVAYLLQEVFQRLARFEKNAEGRGKDKDETVPSGTSDAENDKKRDLDQNLVNDILRVAEREVRRHARFSALARLWAFLTPAEVTSFAPRQISTIDMLRAVQRIVSNPYRCCDYALSVDRWGRAVDVRFSGHAFSDAGAFWRVVNGLEAQGYQFDNTFLDALEALVSFTEDMLKRTKIAGYRGHAVFAVAQYELAIRMCRDETLNIILDEALNFIRAVLPSESDPRESALRALKHAVFHRGSPGAS